MSAAPSQRMTARPLMAASPKISCGSAGRTKAVSAIRSARTPATSEMRRSRSRPWQLSSASDSIPKPAEHGAAQGEERQKARRCAK